MYCHFARRHGIEWALCTHQVEPSVAVKAVVSLWRSDPNRPFSVKDRRRMQVLMPHLVEALHANRAWFFAGAARLPSTGAGLAMAVCDYGGRLHDCSRRFALALRAEWPQWSGAVLPAPLVTRIDEGRYEGRAIDVDFDQLGELWLLRVRSGAAAKRLGPRELRAARLYAKGLSYRAIAGELGVAPSTVRNQLRSSFAKLGVRSKVELARRLGEIDAPG
jgi:DNA-binding CsgD family transcriptional regulator